MMCARENAAIKPTLHLQVASLVGIADCEAATCGKPSSLLLTGRLAPPAPGHYGFNLTFDPPRPGPPGAGKRPSGFTQ
jgi:hypothetical protein